MNEWHGDQGRLYVKPLGIGRRRSSRIRKTELLISQRNPLYLGGYYALLQTGVSMKYYKTRSTKIDINKIVSVRDYHVSKNYVKPVELVIATYRSGISFNKAVDQVAASYKHLNRNTLAKHTLTVIANDY